jgi:ubiquinone/menaquinone biosynthesis C-methylase UbiE
MTGGINMGTFWDFWAPLYDLAEKANGRAYSKMIRTVKRIVPKGATVLETAAGTGEISIAVAEKAKRVLCTDVSDKMLSIVRRKVRRHGIGNIMVDNRDIYRLDEPDGAFDVVIASQILHLIQEPDKAAAELRRVSKSLIILPLSFTKDLHGIARLMVDLYRLFGFAPKVELTANEYQAFLNSIGFSDCKYIHMKGKIPITVAVWKKQKK